MKKEIAILILPIIILFAFALSVDTEEDQMYEQSIVVFEQNIVYINEEIDAGEDCLKEIGRTVKMDGAACAEYIFKKDVSENFTDIGISLLLALFNDGYLIEGEEEFEIILSLVEELARIDHNAKVLSDEIDNRVSSKCVKCAI